MSNIVLKAENVTKKYDNVSEPVLRSVSLTVYAGDFILIVPYIMTTTCLRRSNSQDSTN